MDKRSAPLVEALLAEARRGGTSFHVPGHKSGAALRPEAAEQAGDAAAIAAGGASEGRAIGEEDEGTAGAAAAFDSLAEAGRLFRNVMTVDFTEIPGLDDLHDPSGPIADAQRLAADCYGADETFFLVGGSTAGNLAMVLAVCAPDDIVIVQRNVHKSVIHGLMLAGARAVFLPPRRDESSGLAAGVRPEDVAAALSAHPDATGVLLANPNYYGMTSDLREIAAIVHSHGKPLLVDEAHGAHFGFHSDVPASALAQGADVVVQSTHKMMGALTMGAMLHVRGGRVDAGLLRQRLAVVQSSSPSYPIMASLDWSRRLLHTDGQALLEGGLRAVRLFHRGLAELPMFRAVRLVPGSSAFAALDPFKAALCDATGTLSGFRLLEELGRRGCVGEMADPLYALLLFSFASREADAQRLLAALAAIAGEFRLAQRDTAAPVPAGAAEPESPAISAPAAMRLPRAGGAGTRRVALRDAAGLIAAEMIVPYPPGIPVLYPGERITPATVRYLQSLAATGARFQGAADGGIEYIGVQE
ncbi:MAG: aminotransferase class I/II-fold pyridoxal phosphate-dependent enzyme [Paenibacillaceae bacterium]|nr:aminotransferase class I/II-fold pyridoxal phosphate-dependent enzyme [Paenibacillaceae bacterium]